MVKCTECLCSRVCALFEQQNTVHTKKTWAFLPSESWHLLIVAAFQAFIRLIYSNQDCWFRTVSQSTGATAKPWRACQHPGCTTTASFGTAGTKKRQFCLKHRAPGMVNTHAKKCDHPGCIKQPHYGMASTRKREFCGEHAKKGMENLYPSKTPKNLIKSCSTVA